MQTPFFGTLPADTVPIPGHEGFWYSESVGTVYRHREKSYMVYHQMYPAGWYEVQPEMRYQIGKGHPLSEAAIRRLCFPKVDIPEDDREAF